MHDPQETDPHELFRGHLHAHPELDAAAEWSAFLAGAWTRTGATWTKAEAAEPEPEADETVAEPKKLRKAKGH